MTQQNIDKLRSLCDHLGNQLYSGYRLGTQNCLTASCQHMQTHLATSVMKDKEKGRKYCESLKGFSSFLFIHDCPLTVILPLEEAAVASSFCSSTPLGNSALCFYGWLEAILAFFYVFPIYSYLI